MVPYRTGEEVRRETYLFAGATPDTRPVGFRSRLELYLVGDNVVAASHSHANIVGGFRRESVVGTQGAASLTLGTTTVSACAYTLVEKRRMN